MQKKSLCRLEWVYPWLAVRSNDDETFVLVETLICPLQVQNLLLSLKSQWDIRDTMSFTNISYSGLCPVRDNIKLLLKWQSVNTK